MALICYGEFSHAWKSIVITTATATMPVLLMNMSLPCFSRLFEAVTLYKFPQGCS